MPPEYRFFPVRNYDNFRIREAFRRLDTEIQAVSVFQVQQDMQGPLRMRIRTSLLPVSGTCRPSDTLCCCRSYRYCCLKGLRIVPLRVSPSASPVSVKRSKLRCSMRRIPACSSLDGPSYLFWKLTIKNSATV